MEFEHKDRIEPEDFGLRGDEAQKARYYADFRVAEERERCAKLCEQLSNDWHGHDGKYALEDAANKIR